MTAPTPADARPGADRPDDEERPGRHVAVHVVVILEAMWGLGDVADRDPVDWDAVREAVEGMSPAQLRDALVGAGTGSEEFPDLDTLRDFLADPRPGLDDAAPDLPSDLVGSLALTPDVVDVAGLLGAVVDLLFDVLAEATEDLFPGDEPEESAPDGEDADGPVDGRAPDEGGDGRGWDPFPDAGPVPGEAVGDAGEPADAAGEAEVEDEVDG